MELYIHTPPTSTYTYTLYIHTSNASCMMISHIICTLYVSSHENCIPVHIFYFSQSITYNRPRSSNVSLYRYRIVIIHIIRNNTYSMTCNSNVTCHHICIIYRISMKKEYIQHDVYSYCIPFYRPYHKNYKV
jgi:hypothetical protein